MRRGRRLLGAVAGVAEVTQNDKPEYVHPVGAQVSQGVLM